LKCIANTFGPVWHQAPSLDFRYILTYSPLEASGGGPTQTAKTAPILIVEDDYLIAMQAEDALTDAGFNLVGIAASADQAVSMAEDHRPVLAIMDIRLAGKRDGIDAALELFQFHNIRCIFASAHADQEVMTRARPARPLAWLQKPYTMPSLIAAVLAAFNELGI
jgi:two-component system, response regulator PdtaR